MSEFALSIRGLRKAYASGTEALKAVDLDIAHGEIFALLGPNGAGKTTLISIVCGLVTATDGTVLVNGEHWRDAYKAARAQIGLVPQEMNIDVFEPVWNTVAFSRELFGLKRDDAYLEQVLKDLTLWDKRKAILKELSGGMKRRVMIAKALAHEPRILFLDEPTAGVDVELRKEMWDMVRKLKERGTTIILTTHYIEEAEEMADRVGVINKGELILVEEKAALMKKLGRKTLHLQLAEPLSEIPAALAGWAPQLSDDGLTLTYDFDRHAEKTGIPSLLAAMRDEGIGFKDLDTKQSSLEDIFVGLIRNGNAGADA
ncbi:ABC transporter ATP-binding protein [Sphingomonas astaxanthinifaciens]|uniref:ABC transporter ATP-binding protein n=1 Tax=Sphingomonas astaxanthinifaciens DSM 22298 TaxID=1123267 RepID=A0ABQ5Z6S9_9SPHN|nr:ABC transporter ATP-binding protein [Sphingomonas astaxanthinifaciens]GLR48413.1 ABC transporter ATP-binding protein [Sphingomonas astaxanthinifaciens DSM 22298]